MTQMMQTVPNECVLTMADVGKRFHQNWVLKSVNLKVRRGSIHAIVGHNGAGKSTLMKIALGALEPTEGEVHIGGRRLTYSRPAEARTLGLGMVMQERSLVATMTGIDNLFLNSERLDRLARVDLRRERAEVEDLIRQLGMPRSLLSLRISDMSAIEQELIEIARALRLGSRVLVLDEPTAPLGREEIGGLFDVLRGVAARGTGIVIITHHLAEVFAVSDQVTCLREGSVVMSCPTRETDMSHLIAAMFGRQPWSGIRALGPEPRRASAAAARPAGGSEPVPTLAVGICGSRPSYPAYRSTPMPARFSASSALPAAAAPPCCAPFLATYAPMTEKCACSASPTARNRPGTRLAAASISFPRIVACTGSCCRSRSPKTSFS